MTVKSRLQQAGDGTAIPSKMIGTTVIAQSTTASIAGTGGTRGVGTLAIPYAGRWEITAQLNAPWSGTSGGASMMLSTVSATSNSFPQLVATGISGWTDKGMALSVGGVATQGDMSGIIADFTGAATIYLNTYTVNAVSATNAVFTIQAKLIG